MGSSSAGNRAIGPSRFHQVTPVVVYGHDAQRKFDEYKTSASNTLTEARDNTEKKLEEAKSAGSSWLSWGSSKASDAKKESAEKAKEGAENVKQKADKYS